MENRKLKDKASNISWIIEELIDEIDALERELEKITEENDLLKSQLDERSK